MTNINWRSIAYYTLFSTVVSFIAGLLFANTHGGFLMWGFSLVVGAGYAYGRFETIIRAKQELKKILDDAEK